MTTRDDRRRIVELAEEKSLELDHDVCQKARSDLTNQRTRLSVEIGWLPGVSPRKASQLVENLVNDPMAIRKESGLPTLAHLNLLAAAFEAVDGKHDADDLAEFIMEAAYLAEGQAKLAGEIEESLAVYTTLPLPDFGPGSVIALGAVVVVPIWLVARLFGAGRPPK